MITKNMRNIECEYLYRKSDSCIKEYIDEHKKILERCLKEELEHGWEEEYGDSIITCKDCIEVAKMILRDRKMIEDCKKKYCEFTKKLIQVLAEYRVDYTIEKDECCSGAEIVKISYENKTYQAEVFEKDNIVLFEKESYKITDKTVNDIIDIIGCKNDMRLFNGVTREYGSDPEKIYIELCEKFYWDKEMPDDLGTQEARLSVKNGALELSVGFIENSNWTALNDGSWKNTISEDKDYVVEIWKKKADAYHDTANRIIFAKKQNGQYVFLGVYEVDVIKQDKDFRRKRIWRKIYKKISDSYMMRWL